MSRRRRAIKREIIPDPKDGSELIAKFINNLTKRGKRGLAEKIFYKALDIIEERTEKPGLEVFQKAVRNVEPQLEVKSRRVGGATYQVPMEVRPKRKQALALRWIINNSRSRSGKTMYERLANELQEAFNNEGASIKKKEDTHKMAEANKAFAHFRW